MSTSRVSFVWTALLLAPILLGASPSKTQCRKTAVKLIDERIDSIRLQVGSCETKSDCTFIAVGSGLHVNKKLYQSKRACFDGINQSADDVCTYGSVGKTGGAMANGFGMTWEPAHRPNDYECVDNHCSPIYDKMNPRKNFSIPVFNESITDSDKACREEFNQYLIEKLIKK